MNRVKKLKLGVGLLINAIGFYLFALFFGLTYHKVNNIGWDGQGCSMCQLRSNLAGMNVNYPRVIKLNSSEPVKIETFTNELRPQELGCPTQEPFATTVDYEARLWASGLELSPSSPQKTNVLTQNRVSGAEWVWIVHPKEPGAYSLHAEVSIQVANCTISTLSDTFQIQVVNLFGLGPRQIQILSLLGFIFGTSLTVPGFIALWLQHKDRLSAKAAKKAEEQKSKRKVKIIISSSGQEKEVEINDETQD